jgi:alpha-glucosidase (family GH31 glycosyl hydrolase)
MIGSPANLATSISRGPWWHLVQNRWFEGSRTHRVDAPLEEIPVFLHEGTILPPAFDGESKLGATMRSGVNAPHETVLLVAARTGSTVTYQGFSVAVGSDGHVRA